MGERERDFSTWPASFLSPDRDDTSSDEFTDEVTFSIDHIDLEDVNSTANSLDLEEDAWPTISLPPEAIEGL